MNQTNEILNSFLMDVFNEILRTEEQCITANNFKNLSVKEMHVIEAVCEAEDKDRDNNASSIAKTLNITAGTLTTSISGLERKGYLVRIKDDIDKRVVHIMATELGRKANDAHNKFHRQMIEDILYVLDPEETKVFVKALGSISTFFKVKRSNKRITTSNIINEIANNNTHTKK